VDDVAITLRARENGVVVTPLSLHYRQSPPRQGLILGYTALEQPALQAELKTLRRIFIDLATKH
jgi:DNA-binding transcriptional MocR family regulator